MLVSTGSHALGLWYPGDDLHLVVVMDYSASIFWELASEVTGTELKPKKNQVELDLFDDDHAAGFSGSKVYLSYCGLPPGAVLKASSIELPAYADYVRQSTQEGKTLNRVRDTIYIRGKLLQHSAPADDPIRSYRMNSDQSYQVHWTAFQCSHRRIRRWADSRGIYSKRYGLLDDQILTWQLFDVFGKYDNGTLDKSYLDFLVDESASDRDGLEADNVARMHSMSNSLVHEVFETFAAFGFSYNHVGRGPGGSNAVIVRDSVLCVMTHHWPRMNSVAAMHVQDQKTIADEMLSAHIRLVSNGHLPNTKREALQCFFRYHNHFVLLDLRYWGPNRRKEEAFRRHIQDHVAPDLVKRLRASQSEACFRIWPEPLCSTCGTLDRTYLVGFDTHQNLEEVQEVIETFSSELDYDRSCGLIDISVASREEMAPLAEATSVSDEGASIPNAPVSASASPNTTKQAVAIQATHAASEKSQPFITASKVVTKLQWHPTLQADDYEVGYLDRFDGLMWMPLEQWHKDLTDDEWIPDHRIRAFRRRKDGRVVWDREKRIDLTDEERSN